MHTVTVPILPPDEAAEFVEFLIKEVNIDFDQVKVSKVMLSNGSYGRNIMFLSGPYAKYQSNQIRSKYGYKA